MYSLEDQGLLDIENITHKFCEQYIYKNVINKKLSSFQSAWNVHGLRTENNKSATVTEGNIGKLQYDFYSST